MNQLHHGVPLRLVQLQPVGPMTTRDHQAVPLAHGIGIGDAERIQVAEVACAALKGPLVRSLLSNSPRRSTRSG
jgi:hypothetical protein